MSKKCAAKTTCWVGAILLIATMPVSGACHRYRHWAYKIPQSCHATALARPTRLATTHIAVVIPPPRTREEQEIPLPDLGFRRGGEASPAVETLLRLLAKGWDQ